MTEFIKFLVLLSFFSSNEIECSQKSNPSTDVSSVEMIRMFSMTCFSVEACGSECCKQFYLYSVAKKNCTADIDGQLAAAKWYSPFSKVYHRFWESTCSLNDGSKWKPDNYLLEYSAYFLNNGKECNYFDKFSLIYSNRFLNLSQCDPPKDGMFWKYWLPISTNIVSILLQISTLLLFLLIPELIKSIRDKCFLIYLTTRLVESIFYLALVIFEPTLSDSYCYLMAFGRQFSGLASNFWFNVLCLQVWRSLKVVSVFHRPSSKILRLYSIYAFGCSLAVTVITYIADCWLSNDSHFKPIREPYCSIIVYNFALGSAWFQPTFIYYYSIVMILLIIDSAAFIDISRTISAREKRFSDIKDELRRHQKHHLGISTYLKLFVLMGAVNLWSLVLFLSGSSTKLRMIALLPNFLNGVLVWFIIISRKQVLHAVQRKFLKLRAERVSLREIPNTSNSQPTLTTK